MYSCNDFKIIDKAQVFNVAVWIKDKRFINGYHMKFLGDMSIEQVHTYVEHTPKCFKLVLDGHICTVERFKNQYAELK